MGSLSRENYLPTGFTLAELLVVVGIIAIVIGLLLPALSSARRSVGGITCESNFRQWAMATQMYANENNGFLPREARELERRFRLPGRRTGLMLCRR